MKRQLSILFLLLFGALFAYGQTNGVPSFGATDAHDFDTVNLTNLVPTFTFPVLSKSVGALPGSVSIESSQYCETINTPRGQVWTCSGETSNPGVTLYGVEEPMLTLVPQIGTTTTSNGCTTFQVLGLIARNQTDSHPIAISYLHYPAACGTTTLVANTVDGSGYTVTFSSAGGSVVISSLTSASGWSLSQITGGTKVTDSFSNALTLTSTTTGTFTDSLGAITTLVGGTSAPGSYQYTDTNGSTQNITLTTGTSQSFQPTAAECTSTPPSLTVTPITFINYPDGTSFGLGWQTNNGGLSGLIDSITLRTGGTISYTYGAPAGACTTWYYTSLSRTTSDGTTTYTLVNNGDYTVTTTVLDPGKNKTVYTFLGVPNSFIPNQSVFTQSIYRYQNTGTVASPVYTLVSNTSYCYNTVCGGTTTPTYPITQRDVYQYVGTNSLAMSHTTELYDSYGDVTSHTAYDYITGQTIVTTSTFSGCGQGSTIQDHPCDVKTVNGSNTVSETQFAYNANGAMTSKKQWKTGSTWMTTSYIPNANGTMASLTEPNLQVRNFGYAATGSGGCNGLLPTSSSTTVNGVALTTSQTWDCNGGLVTSTTDVNSNEDDTTYDSMLRISSYTDKLEKQTTFGYTSNSASSTDPLSVYRVQYADGLGRTIISQTKQSPTSSNYDTVSTSYNWATSNGDFATHTSVPCVKALDQTCPTTASTTWVSPAGLSSTGDVNGGYDLYARNANDTSVTAGPAPSGPPAEHVKTVQTERDGFGRIKSVCALQTSGGTACGQVMGNSGILTSSSYSFGSGSSTVTTTRGSQTHTTVLDAVGRQTSVTTPEAGTVTKTHDSVNYGMCGNRTSNGDLLMVKNNSGGYICYWYDGLHRVTDVGEATSLTAWTGNSRRFRYDAADSAHTILAPPSGYVGNNLVGRVVEVLTDNYASPVVPFTDEWFSYDKDGRVTDMWESTPHSNGYYHTTVGYDADGTVTSLSGIPGYSTLTWGVDGEGRPNSLSYGLTTIVSATAGNGFQYDAASRPLNVPIGTSGDQDTYTYDSLGQMKTYTFAVNGKSDAGTLTWNANGSLASLAIVDTFNGGGSQTCSFSYDDVTRLITDNCGSTIWNQTYDYGVNGGEYENLSKTGNPGTSWIPGYNTANNEMIGSSYDGNGQLTYDGTSSYSWDVYGKMACTSSGTTCPVYDAFGRIVEIDYNGGTAQQELLLSAIGKVADMNGQSGGTLLIPAPGGGTFNMYGGVMYFLHPDWLGSKRLSTSISGRTYAFDTAYTPYGETYDTFGSLTYPNFTGDSNDVSSGLWDTPNRELATNASRWLSPDPAGASWNAYAYPTDPNRMVDPSGLGPIIIDGHQLNPGECRKDANGFRVCNGQPDPDAKAAAAINQMATEHYFAGGFWGPSGVKGSDAAFHLVMGTFNAPTAALAHHTCGDGVLCQVGVSFATGLAIGGVQGIASAGSGLTLLSEEGALSGTGKALAGHGHELLFAGTTRVPEGTTIMIPGDPGLMLKQPVGLAMEAGDLSAASSIPGSTTYLPGAEIPNLLLRAPGDLTTLPRSITVSVDTWLSGLLKPGMGNLCWAACRLLPGQ